MESEERIRHHSHHHHVFVSEDITHMTPSSSEATESWWDFNNYNATDLNVTTANTSVIPELVIGINPVFYFYCLPPMLLLCIVSLAVNLKVLIAVHWIRRPLSPTLHISLSLAAADAYTSAIVGIGLFWNSLLPKIVKIEGSDCFDLTLETFRLSGMLVTVCHLLALTGNHYLGILRPLHYVSTMTRRNTTVMLVMMWLFPIACFFIYVAALPGDGFQADKCSHKFLAYFKFRLVFSFVFLIPLLLMVVIYGHIFVIVKRHQESRLQYSRAGSRRVTGGNNNAGSAAALRRDNEQQMHRNVKAVQTTLFILGSFVVGWIPAVVVFLLKCEDCLYTNKDINITLFFFGAVTYNTLTILKTLANPIIYASRMQEIKTATRRMNMALRRRCCCSDNDNGDEGGGPSLGGTCNSETNIGRLSLYSSRRGVQCTLHGHRASTRNNNGHLNTIL